MTTILSDRTHVARKRYRCDACKQWLLLGFHIDLCETDEQRRAVILANNDRWSILPGTRYRRVCGIHDGDFFVLKSRIDMHEVCDQLSLWDEEQ